MSDIKIVNVPLSELVDIIKNVVGDEFQKTSKTEDRTDPYTKDEICKLFNITMPTVDGWSRSGELKRMKIKGRVYFLAKDVHELLNSKK